MTPLEQTSSIYLLKICQKMSFAFIETFLHSILVPFFERQQNNLVTMFNPLMNKQRRRKRTLWPQSASKLYRPSDRRLLVKLVLTFFANRGCHVVNVTNPYGSIFSFLDRSRYYFFQAAP
jgi:hypothetical protein